MLKPFRSLSIGIFAVFIITIFTYSSIAGVYFIVDSVPGKSILNTRKKQCTDRGYLLSQCFGTQIPHDICPQDNTWFRRCVCDTTRFKFDTYNCPYPKIISGESCNGKFENCECDEKFQYTEKNCPSPKVLSGMKCNGKYEICSCPSTYYKTCKGNMIGDGESCNGKFQSCKCSSIFKTCNKGSDPTASRCFEESGTLKYSRCSGNSCENGGYIDSVPVNHKCSEIKYFENTCYRDCKKVTCFDGGMYDRNPSSKITCPRKDYKGNLCYDCDQLCGYCDRFTGQCKQDCLNDCKKGIWFENKINGGFTCIQQ